MKSVLVLLLSLTVGCQTLVSPPKTCEQLMEEVAAEHTKAGRVQVDGGRDEAGAIGGVFWDFKSPSVEVDFITPPDYPMTENLPADMREVGECTFAAKEPDGEPSVWKHWKRTVLAQ